MPSERELIERAVAAYNETGPEAVLDVFTSEDALAPGFGARVQPDAPNGGEWPGLEGYREMARTWLEVWETFTLTPHEYVDLGNGRWLVPLTQSATTSSGADLAGEFVYSFAFEGGQLAEIGIWSDPEQARAHLEA